jgi:hypothetical protein
LLIKKISSWLDKNKKFLETQYGFRGNKGRTENVAIVKTEIIKAIEGGFSGKLLAFVFNRSPRRSYRQTMDG